jgi:hypothetical protein
MTPPESEVPAESRGVLRYAVLVALFAALLVLPPLGRRVILSGDEARFAMLAQDMMKRQSWTDAHVRDRRYRNKPFLYPWAIRALSTPGDVRSRLDVLERLRVRRQLMLIVRAREPGATPTTTPAPPATGR